MPCLIETQWIILPLLLLQILRLLPLHGLDEVGYPLNYQRLSASRLTGVFYFLRNAASKFSASSRHDTPTSGLPLASLNTSLNGTPWKTIRMTSYFSSITSSSAISNLGTRLNSLRRAIISGEEVDDLDNEDCSHVSNVLRAYYAEKGRPFPPWLPPDPKAPAPPPSRIVATTQIQASGYGQPPGAPSSYGRGGLSDLWGDSGAAQPPPSQTASLRRGRPGMPPNPMHSAPPATPGTPTPTSTPPPSHPAGARPLPSQRAGSYQPSQSSQPSQLAPSRVPLDRASSAQERLRARLHGGRSPSPNLSGGSGSPYYGSSPSARKPVGMGPRA